MKDYDSATYSKLVQQKKYVDRIDKPNTAKC